MQGPIDMEQKVSGSIGCWTHYVTLNYDLDLGFQGQILKELYLRDGRANWHGTKKMGFKIQKHLFDNVDINHTNQWNTGKTNQIFLDE